MRFVLSAVLLFPALFLHWGPASRPIQPVSHLSVIIQAVSRNSEAEKCGIQKGDVILSARSATEQSRIETPFDVSVLEIEQAPKGPVVLTGQRSGVFQEWTLQPGIWGIEVRPHLPSELLATLERAEASIELGDAEATTRALNEATSLAQNVEREELREWLKFAVARHFARSKNWEHCDRLFRQLIEDQPELDHRTRVYFLVVWARTFEQRNDLKEAENLYRRAYAVTVEAGFDTLLCADVLHSLAVAKWRLGDLNASVSFADRALSLRERLAPRSLDVARSLNALGVFAQQRGDLGSAEQYHERALGIARAASPESLDVGKSLNNLAAIAQKRGNLAKAEQYYIQDLEVLDRVQPESLSASYTWSNLGLVAFGRGDLLTAEACLRRGLALQDAHHSSRDVALNLNNLGSVLKESGDTVGAESSFRRALAIQETQALNSLAHATTLNNLGGLLRLKERLPEARRYHSRALTIRRKLAPESLMVAESEHDLADVYRNSGSLSHAAKLYQDAARIRSRLAPQSASHAESLASLARIDDAEGRLTLAHVRFEQALEILDQQSGQLGGAASSRLGFRAKYGDYYSDYIALLMRTKQTDRAFAVLERSRARVLLETLSAGQIDRIGGIDSSLLLRQRQLRERLDELANQRMRLLRGDESGMALRIVTSNHRKTLAEYRLTEGRILGRRSEQASQLSPQPMTAPEAQRLLGPETALLEYSLGETRSFLFVVTADAVVVHTLPSRKMIDDMAHQVYELLSVPAPPASPEEHGPGAGHIMKKSTELASMILGPAERVIRDKKRLLIVADGMLHYIPFAALQDPNRSLDDLSPLVARHEVVSLPSASVIPLMRLEKRRPVNGAPAAVAVFADPVFNELDSRISRDKHSRGLLSLLSLSPEATLFTGTNQLLKYLPRLIESRTEAQAIVESMSGMAVTRVLDFHANRERALNEDLRRYRILHFATHAFFDDQYPEMSGLIFSQVNERGSPTLGFVSLEDIFGMRIAADLVVLSACETALGRLMSSEGVIGLARGFIHAGASRVVASLWKVDDAATGFFMRTFYESMVRFKVSPAAALRAAQLEMLSDPRWASPHYWAAFTIQGDWQPVSIQ